MLEKFREHLRLEAHCKVAADIANCPDPYPARDAWLAFRLKHPIGHWLLENLFLLAIATVPLPMRRG